MNKQKGATGIELLLAGAVIVWATAWGATLLGERFATDCVNAGGEWTEVPASCTVFPYTKPELYK